MNTILQLSGQLLGIWLAITGAAIGCGAVCVIVGSLRQWKLRRRHAHEGLAGR